MRLPIVLVLLALGCLMIGAFARPATAWAEPADILNHGNPFENGDFARELHVGDQYFGYVLSGVTINVGGITEAGTGPAPYDYPRVLVEYAEAVRASGGTTGYGDWGISDFDLHDVEVASNDRSLKFSGLPTTSHCCQNGNETTYNYPRTAYLLLIEEASYWSEDGKYFHGTFALMTRNLGSTMDLWDQGTAGTTFVYADWVVEGDVVIDKQSLIPGVTEGNPLYSLEGAKFGIYDAAGTLLDTLTTDANGHAEKQGLLPGPYTLVELEPPAGYLRDEQAWPFEVVGGQTTRMSIGDMPLHNPLEAWAYKADAETGGEPQGTATLAGAEFTIRYYNGYYDAAALPATPTRTWTVATDASGRAVADEAHRVAGDEFYRDLDGNVTIPLGTVSVVETKAPEGYLLEDAQGNPPESVVIQITGPASGGAVLDVYDVPTFSDRVLRGGVAVGKIDRQSKLPHAQGAAQLAGAQFEIVSLCDKSIRVDGENYSKNDVVATITAVDDGTGKIVAQTAEDLLPYGSYLVREKSSGLGYLYDSESKAWSKTFAVTSSEAMVDLTETDSSASNQVVRGDFSFSKVESTTMERMSLVPFRITSATTSESHIIVTDENGMAATDASWNAHSANTNANDAAVQPDGSIDESALDPTAGIWFSGYADETVDVDDSLGALPFDTYRVEELPSDANRDHVLVAFTVAISRHDRTLDLGTVDDDALDVPQPSIGTTAHDSDSGTNRGMLGEQVTIVDTVAYENLEPGVEYVLEGVLMDKESASPLLVDGGQVISHVSFTPEESDGEIEVVFEFDGTALEPLTVVVFEQLVLDEVVIAEHADIDSAEQSVLYEKPVPEPEPSISTTAHDAESGTHKGTLDETVRIVDVVAYEGLEPGAEYTLEGMLMDKATNAPLLVGNDKVTSQVVFTPEEARGQVDVVFEFAGSELDDVELVVFETLTRDGEVVTEHADIDSASQTVVYDKPEPEPEEPEPEPEEPDEPEPEPEEPEPEPDKPEPEPEEPKPEPEEPEHHLPKTGDELVGVPFLALAALCATGAIVVSLRSREHTRKR